MPPRFPGARNVKITIKITAQKIADMMISAIEGNHMTRSWCAGLYWNTQEATPPNWTGGPWYANPDMYDGCFQIEVHEIVDESKPAQGDNVKIHKCNQFAVQRGIELMARSNPRHFGDWMADQDDGETADIFLQCVALGEVRYG